MTPAASCSTGVACPPQPVIAFNGQGRQGLPGTPGAAGIAGAKGEQGPQGPGATSVSTTVTHESAATIATLNNGLVLEGICGSGVALLLKTPASAKTVTGWGTVTVENKLYSEENSGVASLGAESGTQVDVDLTARGSSTSAFEHVHAHGSPGSPCTFAAMPTIGPWRMQRGRLIFQFVGPWYGFECALVHV